MMSLCLSVYMVVCLSVCLPACLSFCGSKYQNKFYILGLLLFINTHDIFFIVVDLTEECVLNYVQQMRFEHRYLEDVWT